jgi:hypothetical protein
VIRTSPAIDPFARALVAGFIAATATLVLCGPVWGAAMLIAAHAFSAPAWAAPAVAWLQLLPRTGLVDPAGPMLYQVLGVYFVAGLLWAPVYTHIFSVRMTSLQWERGLVFACVPWLFSSVVLLPMAGGGLLGLGFGAGPLPLIGSLALYAVYGVALTRLTGPVNVPGRERVWTGDVQSAATHGAEVGAAAGVVAGLVIGAAFGLSVITVFQSAGVPGGVSMHPLGLFAASTFVGGALGGLIGSFLGLARAEGYS